MDCSAVLNVLTTNNLWNGINFVEFQHHIIAHHPIKRLLSDKLFHEKRGAGKLDDFLINPL
jgi:hypothetical protein